LAEVKDSVMTVLANSAESPQTIDASSAKTQVQEADEKFSNMSFYDPNYHAAQDALKLAEARVEASALKLTAR
jgi:F0F1-type ATP synthase epsilon subunit